VTARILRGEDAELARAGAERAEIARFSVARLMLELKRRLR
jgi:hypothetical protein